MTELTKKISECGDVPASNIEQIIDVFLPEVFFKLIDCSDIIRLKLQIIRIKTQVMKHFISYLDFSIIIPHR